MEYIVVWQREEGVALAAQPSPIFSAQPSLSVLLKDAETYHWVS